MFGTSSMSSREWVDRQTHTPQRIRESKPKVTGVARFAALVASSGTPKASSGRAAMIEAQIARLLRRR